jgi:hypothetical protein
VFDAIALWRTCEGKPGVAAAGTMTAQALEAFAVIDEARAAKMLEEAEARRTK